MTEIQRIVLTGGGTGGHIYPALALYRRFIQQYPKAQVLYIGTERGLESKIVPQEGIPFETIDIEGLRRSLSPKNLQVAFKMLTATHKAKKILKDFKPDLVLGTGGFVCGPVLLGAAQLKIPTIIHEQNSGAGITNKFLARFVDQIATCFEDVQTDFSKYADKLALVGNPRGQEVMSTSSQKDILSQQFDLQDSLPTVLVFGGSRGAPAINAASLAALDLWQQADYQVIIATGQSHYDALDPDQVAEINASPNVRICPYIANMPSVFQAIQLVVCRAGATTLAELTALGLASILIPSPYVTNNHQEHNAQALVNQEAAMMIKEEDLTADRLYQVTDHLMKDPDQLEEMSKKARAMGRVDACDHLIRMMQNLIAPTT